MSERELTQHFGTRVEARFKPISLHVLQQSVNGITKEILRERYPDRKKQLKRIKKEIEGLIKDLL
jgi:hypothetical protein